MLDSIVKLSLDILKSNPNNDYDIALIKFKDLQIGGSHMQHAYLDKLIFKVSTEKISEFDSIKEKFPTLADDMIREYELFHSSLSQGHKRTIVIVDADYYLDRNDSCPDRNDSCLDKNHDLCVFSFETV